MGDIDIQQVSKKPKRFLSIDPSFRSARVQPSSDAVLYGFGRLRKNVTEAASVLRENYGSNAIMALQPVESGPRPSTEAEGSEDAGAPHFVEAIFASSEIR